MSIPAAKTKVRSALRNLHKFGADALKPSKLNNDITSQHPFNQRQIWRKPLVSKRVAKRLRKKAIREGTYGSYDATTGVGWDVNWDTPGTSTSTVTNGNNIAWMKIRPHKETKRERTREARAKKIEDMLTTADDKILDYRRAEIEKKPEPGIENVIKNMMKKSRK